MKKITLFDAPDQIQRINAYGWSGYFRFVWNVIGEHWTMDILDDDKELIVGTIKLIPGVPLLTNYVSVDLPDGDIVMLDSEGSDEPPTLDNFASRYVLIIAPQDEIDAAV